VSADDDDAYRRPLQTIQASDDSDGSDDSDLEWEDALGEGNGDDDDALENDQDADMELRDISITFGGGEADNNEHRKKARRRGITSVDRKRRIDIHKLHILCLLYHVHRRNAWCNDEKVQASLRKLPTADNLSNLVPNPEFTQYQASKRFLTGIQGLSTLWQKRFSVTALGMQKPHWTDAEADVQAFSAFDDYDMPMDKQDFRKAAATLHGSQDVGAQLFCALLRSIGVEARLVCSLQCLPFASVAQPSTPQKQLQEKNTIHIDPFNQQVASRPKSSTPSRPKRLSRLERVLGERHPSISSNVRAVPKARKNFTTSYPVYWVEVFNSAHQKWIPVDPHSTSTVDKADKLEPPLNYAHGSLAYVVAFDEDYTVKDVTRRYAKAYNAKTRKLRIESTEGGAKWWKRALKPFKRTAPLDRDQVEDAALARKEAAEGIPKNVQDFKDHPIYVLERHLKHNEVIHPMHQVGKVNVGSSLNPKMEPIYRRKDVHIVRSADKWYRLGRDVKDGEQPLKHAKPRKGARRSIPPDAEFDEQNEEIGAGLYALFQTELYIPPPVVNGRVPRNAFGNLDLYVPSMVPPGGAHIRHKLASKAARIVGVDSADAVTGFSFKGRHGTAIIQGAVVAQEYQEAVEAVIEAMEYAQEEAENSQRRDEALRMWRRFFLGLRIAQRVNAIEIDGETGPVINVQEEVEKEDRKITEEQLAGGFFMDDRGAAEPTATATRPLDRAYQDNEYGGGFVPTDDETGGGFMPEDPDYGGGFIPEASAAFGSSLLSEQQLRAREREDAHDRDMGLEQEEDDTAEPSPGASGSNTRVVPMPQGEATTGDLGGGFIPEDTPMEDVDTAPDGPVVQPPSDTRLTQDFSQVEVAEQQKVVQAQEAGAAVSSEVVQPNGNSSPSRREPEPESEPEPPNSSPSEAGSLPLEDPEDEDADPDWLVDAT
jgi:xeroderma pigmentosum group C-complementing protein